MSDARREDGAAGRALTGRCLCGAISFRMRRPFRPVAVCHCRQCGRWSGHSLAATAVLSDRLDIEGASLAWYGSSPGVERGFCRICGSSLFWRAGDGRLTSVMAGTLDPPTGLRTDCHIFTADASDYAAVPDDAPHHPGRRPVAWDPSAGAP